MGSEMCIRDSFEYMHSTARESHSAVHAFKACKTWQCKCIAPCQQARSTARESHSAVHALKACKTLAMQLHCTVPAGTQHGSREPQCCACTPSMQNFGNANALHRASRHTARLERATVLCMHSKHAKLGNATALHRASRHAARLQGATVLCMRSKHAKLGNANALHRASRHTARPEIAICLLYTSPSPRDGLLSRMPSSA